MLRDDPPKKIKTQTERGGGGGMLLFCNEFVGLRRPSGFRNVVVKRKRDVPAACSSSKHGIFKKKKCEE